MPRISVRTKTALAVALLALPAGASAQTYKVDKYDIGGPGGTDYLSADPATGRVYISRATHVMVVDGATGKVVGDIPETPRVHGIAFAPKHNHGFTTNAGDSTVTMFDTKTLAVIKKIHAGTDGLDGIMYDDATDRIFSINHSHPMGSVVAIDANTGDVVGTATLSGRAPEGGASDGKGKLYVNIEDKNSIDVLDAKTLKVIGNLPIEPCDGPTGIALDRASNRIFAGCSKTSVVVDVASGKVISQIANGDGVDALSWDPQQKLIYIPAGRNGNITVVHQDTPDKYSVVATVPTMVGAKTVALDPATHKVYVFTPEYGPAPVQMAGSTAPAAAPAPGGRPLRGPVIGAWFIVLTH
jgi:DNA-binding beta-propeller fold protein YncE